jgi:choline kinase
VKAIILAAGEGSRLRPYTLDRPKCLVEIAGRSLLDRQLDVLELENISPVILIGGYRGEMLRREGIELRINPLYAETNMVWTLFCAEADLNSDVIVSYGDIVYSREVLRTLLSSQADIAVTIDLDWEHYYYLQMGKLLRLAKNLSHWERLKVNTWD